MEYLFNYLIHIRRIPAPMPIARIWCHDLTFVHSGEFTYEVENQRFTVRAGEALYCPKKAARMREKSEEAYYTSLNFQVIPESTLNLPYHIKRADSAELRFYLKRLLQVYKAEGKYVQEKCSSLIVADCLHADRAQPDCRRESLCERDKGCHRRRTRQTLFGRRAG